MIERVRDFKCSRLKVDNKSFEEVIPNFPTDLIYLDPPYYMKKDSDNKMFKGWQQVIHALNLNKQSNKTQLSESTREFYFVITHY